MLITDMLTRATTAMHIEASVAVMTLDMAYSIPKALKIIILGHHTPLPHLGD